MPITRRQFELEIDAKIEEWMRKIHSFLAEHKDEAFNEDELRQHYSPPLVGLLSDAQKRYLQVKGKGDPFDILPGEKWSFDRALEKLVDLRAVEKATIRASEYYAYKRDLEDVL